MSLTTLYFWAFSAVAGYRLTENICERRAGAAVFWVLLVVAMVVLFVLRDQNGGVWP